MKKTLTIKDIASLAGVSITTVSRVMNKYAWVSENTREKVEAVINAHQFSPNLMARGMISKQSLTLAIVVSDITNPYFVMLVAQIQRACLHSGYRITLYDTQSANKENSGRAEEDEVAIFQSIVDSQIDGAIILGGYADYQIVPTNYLTALRTLMEKIPVVVAGQPNDSLHYSCVERDQRSCVALAVKHLHQAGRQRLAFVGGSSKVYMTHQRVAAFREAVSQAGLPVQESWVVLNNFYAQHGYQAIASLLDQPEQPDAIVAINDRVAMGALRALADRGLRVPQDLAVISCEHFPGSEYFIPRITTVDHRNHALGQQIIRQILALLAGDLPPADDDLPHAPLLIAGESA